MSLKWGRWREDSKRWGRRNKRLGNGDFGSSVELRVSLGGTECWSGRSIEFQGQRKAIVWGGSVVFIYLSTTQDEPNVV